MHNPFIYELSNQIGRYASRTRFVEVFLNINGGALSDSDYYGAYALTEKISRDEDRLPWIAYFLSMARNQPSVAGIFSRLTVRIPAIPDSPSWAVHSIRLPQGSGNRTP